MDENLKASPTLNSTIDQNNSIRDTFGFLDSGYLSFTPSCSNYDSSYNSKLMIFPSKRLHLSHSEPYPSVYNRKHKNIKSSICGSFAENIGAVEKNTSINFSKSHVKSILDDSKHEHSTNTFKMKLRSYYKKHNQSSTSSLLRTTPENNLNDIFSILSVPEVPSSSFSFESEDNIKMELVIPQSTPCIGRSALLTIPLHSISFSPIGYTAKPFISSINNKRFNNLSISDQVASISKKSKPRKLDFNKYTILANFQRQKAAPDYTGNETVDIFKLLGEKSNHPRIVSKILSYMSAQDLCSISMVSKSWRKICSGDTKAQERRLKHIILRQCFKENFRSVNKSKFEDEVQMSPKSRHPSKGLLTVLPTNLLQVPKVHLTPTSPPVSPSKIIFHSFMKARRSLAPRDQLVPCPHCKFACRVEYGKNMGMCSRQGCPMEEFCVFCSSKLHADEACKIPLLATPTKRNNLQQSVVGTKQCKRNLRRISRLK